MRKYRTLLKPYLRNILNHVRDENGVTQEEMSHRLYMSTRSYCDLESGKSGFSAATLIFLLSCLPDDVIVQVVRGFFELVLKEREKEVPTRE